MTQEIVNSEEFQELIMQVSEVINALAEAIRGFAQIVDEELRPVIWMVIECLRRCGFYTQFYYRLIRHKRLAWWIAWHVPSWLTWKLPLDWVAWSI